MVAVCPSYIQDAQFLKVKQLRGLYAQRFFTFRTAFVQ
jgi:hypothetical protein